MEIICFCCRRSPSEIEEYIEAAREEMRLATFRGEVVPPYSSKVLDSFAEEYVKSEEGTYNRVNGHFACTDCYVAMGAPSSPQGWKAP